MAKQPETVDRFRVTCEAPRHQLGDIIAELTKLGVPHIEHELITDVLTYKKPKKFDVNSADFLREYIKEHPTFTRKEAIAHFAESGRSDDQASNAIYILVKEKEIRKLGVGNYQRADIKAITGPKKAKAPKGEPAKKKRAAPAHIGRYDVSNADLILRAFRNRKSFTSKDAEALLEGNGRPRKSAAPCLLKMRRQDRTVKRIGEGEYEVIKAKTKAHVNGSAGESPKISQQEGVSNGT